MTLSKICLMIGIIAAVMTALMYFLRKNKNIEFKNIPYSFMQNFVGALFIFSGGVKAVDPLGTAYKLEQYFAEFENTFEATWFSFMSGLFPWLAGFALAVSIVVIIFEIVLGLMLILGHAKKFTNWSFLLLVIFFTFLTGFTYLTGHVPTNDIYVLENNGETIQVFDGEEDEKLAEGWTKSDSIKSSFFIFKSWGPWVETNMKVTDCGCFGDFLKLKPFTSFLKDIFLLIPGILFLIFGRHSHTLFPERVRTRQIITGASIILLLGYTYYYSVVEIPANDFRPFKNGTDVRTIKQDEAKAQGEVQVIAFTIRNTKTGQVAEIPMASYGTDIENYKEEDGWDRGTIDQIKTEPSIPRTKISDYAIQGEISTVVDYAILVDPEGDTIHYDATMISELGDTTGWKYLGTKPETTTLEGDIENYLLADENYSFMIVCNKLDKANKSAFENKINALHAGAEGDGLQFYVVTNASDEYIESFRQELQTAYVFHTADDILLKTIIRSNPGIVLWKDGKIIKKWHYNSVPTYDKIKEKYMK